MIKILFLTIQFSISHLFAFSLKCRTVLFNPLIGPYQVLPLWATINLKAITMKGCSAFSKASALLEPHHQIVLVSYPGYSLKESYLSGEMQSVYSSAPADWAAHFEGKYSFLDVKTSVIKLHIYIYIIKDESCVIIIWNLWCYSPRTFILDLHWSLSSVCMWPHCGL